MAMAYKSLTSKYPEYRNRWILDDKWMEIIRNNYIDNPSKEKEAGLKFLRRNLVKAIGSRWGGLQLMISQKPTKKAYSVIGISSVVK